MPTTTNPPAGPTFLEKVDLLPGLLSLLLGTTTYAAITAPFRGTWGADTYTHHVTHSLVRRICARFSTAQLQYLNPSFEVFYQRWCAAEGHKEEVVEFAVPGEERKTCKAFWMGDHTKAKYTVIYFHGGGFSLDGDDSHLKYWDGVRKTLAAADGAGTDVAFLFVAYTLVPHGTYPTQLREGVAALSYALNTLGKPPGSILLAGDSAGGNMCLAVLSHLIHPSSDVSSPAIKFPPGQKLKGLVLVAPWTSFRVDWPSAERNKYKDVIEAETGRKWGMDYLAGRTTDAYAEALNAPVGWWKGAEAEYVEGIVSVAGRDEMLVDPIEEWVRRYQADGNTNITSVVAKNEIHIAPIIEPKFGDTKETEQGKAIKAWLKARL